jgi:peptide/nickel transport system ATP-binding protein
MLEVHGLEVGFAGQRMPVLTGLDLSIGGGETVALVGESGSGKSLTALSIMRLLPRGAAIRAGSITFDDQDVLTMSSPRLNRLRGGEVAMLFQQPLAMLDPSATVGSQVAEAVRQHDNLSGRAARDRVVELFREVGIPAPEARTRAYAFQLSGGLAQRVMIAAALAGNPRLLIADEPTTALDVTVQLQVLRLLAREREQRRLSTLLITHDLGVVAALADRILVLYAGRVVEEGTRDDILQRPQHPYTQALVRASLLRPEPDGSLFALAGTLRREELSGHGCCFLARCATADALDLHQHCAAHEPTLAEHGDPGHRVRCCAPRVASAPAPHPVDRTVRERPERGAIATLRAVSKHYQLGRAIVRSVEGVDLVIHQGEALGLVGESGCGKSTLARLLLHMQSATHGQVQTVGHDVARMSAKEQQALHRDAQLVFQDPVGAFDPRMRLGDSLLAPLAHNRIGAPQSRRAAVLGTMRDVGLGEDFYDRLPRECSGGQLQRAVIARALLMAPKLLICDEPTSALDASIRAQILNLLAALRITRDLTLLMITHDLRVVRHLCDRVAVMYLGEIVEVAETASLFARPAHPYTQALIAASLVDEHGLTGETVRGEPPSPLDLPTGCRFHTRCDLADQQCANQHPPLADVMERRAVRCWHWQAAIHRLTLPR